MAQKDIDALGIGSKIDNNELCRVFGCSGQGGMRRAHETSSLVLICNHVRSLYDDRWTGDTLLYTGMGTQGDQSLSFSQNKTLYKTLFPDNNKDKDVSVYLFEVFKDKEYTFMGRVYLSEEPYPEQQIDKNGTLRKVYIFPLKLISQRELQLADVKSVQKSKDQLLLKASDEDVFVKASGAEKSPSRYRIKSIGFNRDLYVSEYAKRSAKGICQLCELPAPFKDKYGNPYLESHHVVWLAKGGEDSIENIIALCPNCHVKMHIVNNAEDVKKLTKKAMEQNYSLRKENNDG